MLETVCEFKIIPAKCEYCNERVNLEDQSIHLERSDAYWHVDCFLDDAFERWMNDDYNDHIQHYNVSDPQSSYTVYFYDFFEEGRKRLGWLRFYSGLLRRWLDKLY